MQIELYIDGEKKIFTTPFVPMLAKRKYLEVMAKSEEKQKEDPTYITSAKAQLEEENELLGILTDVVFKGQFTIEQLINGADNDYIYAKLREAVFGEKLKEETEEDAKKK